MNLEQLSPHGERKGTFRVVIETTRGCRNKYSYKPDEGVFELKKVLPEGHVFPYDFGFIPQTKGEDGDPLDVLVLMDEPTFPGCVVDCRLIGLLQARQTENGRTFRNDRFIAVAERAIMYRRYHDAADVDPDVLAQIKHFFVSYNELAGRRFTPMKIVGATAARKAVAIAPAA